MWAAHGKSNDDNSRGHAQEASSGLRGGIESTAPSVVSALLADATVTTDGRPGEVDPESDEHQTLFLGVALLVTTVVWVVFFVVRIDAHQINVDDYAYASLARNILHSGSPISTFLHSGASSPLVPALAAPGAELGGVYGAMSVELPFLLVLVAGSFLLARLWLSPLAAMVAALAVALNENVSSYALMLHFGVPTAAELVWAFYSYIRSRQFREWKWSLIFGLAIAALLLTRSMSIVYVVPLVVIAGIDLAIDMVKNGNVLRLPALGAVAATLVLAGPWWLVSGHTALHYLQSAGYQPSTGYTSKGATLDLTAIRQRASWTLAELGWGESWALGIALVAALWVVVRHHRTLKLTALWTLAAWAILTTLILSSSSNNGTAFGLPVLVILILLAAAVLGQMSWRLLPAIGVVLAGILVVGLVGETTGYGWWWPAAPYRGEVENAGGTVRTNSDLITAQVTQIIGSSPTLIAQDSDILNNNGIGWYAGTKPLSLVVLPTTLSGTRAAIRDLSRVRTLITGSTLGSYHRLVNQGAVESAALKDGFHVTHAWLGKGFSILVWQRGTAFRTATVAPPTTSVQQPRVGTEVKGNTYLVATASDDVLAITGMKFIVRGMDHMETVRGWSTIYGWFGALGTAALPDGSYTVQSVVFDADGAVGMSRPVNFRIAN